MATTTVTVSGAGGGFAQQVRTSLHQLAADEPAAAGGTATGPDPYELLLSALGACMSMTVGLYARRKQWPLEHVSVTLRHSRVHAADCADCEAREGLLDFIEATLELRGPLTDEQRARMLEIAQKCPVHRTLTSQIKIQARLLEVPR